MRARAQAELPTGLMQAHSRLEAWRGQRLGRERIPASLWRLAVRLVSSSSPATSSCSLSPLSAGKAS